MIRARSRSRDPRNFRGDVVELLNRLQHEGLIAGYQLSPREPGELDVPEIAIRISERLDPEAVLRSVRNTLRDLPHFETLGGDIVLHRSDA